MRILGLIPARGGSKGIPEKNLRPLAGRPLIMYTLAAATMSRYLTHRAVSTDAEAIASLATAEKLQVVRRPAELALDDTPMMPVVAHAVSELERENCISFDYVVLLQPTSPLRTSADIDGTIEKLIKSQANCVVSITECREHPLRAKRLIGDRLIPFCDPEPAGGLRQELPTAYRRNGAVYAFRRALAFAEDPIRLGDVCAYLMPQERSVDIDTEIDFAVAQAYCEAPIG